MCPTWTIPLHFKLRSSREAWELEGSVQHLSCSCSGVRQLSEAGGGKTTELQQQIKQLLKDFEIYWQSVRLNWHNMFSWTSPTTCSSTLDSRKIRDRGCTDPCMHCKVCVAVIQPSDDKEGIKMLPRNDWLYLRQLLHLNKV